MAEIGAVLGFESNRPLLLISMVSNNEIVSVSHSSLEWSRTRESVLIALNCFHTINIVINVHLILIITLSPKEIKYNLNYQP